MKYKNEPYKDGKGRDVFYKDIKEVLIKSFFVDFF
jgi:hypothetical protein